MPTASGTVLALARWPVKSMAGEEVRALRVDGRGAGGDRTHAVQAELGGTWKRATARELPRLLAWRASYPFNLDAGLDPAHPPHATVTGPNGRQWRWGDPRLARALEEDLGRPARLERDPEGLQDLPRTLLVTTRASHEALEAELGEPVDLRRFRTNVHLDLDAPPWAELAWEGAVLTFAGGVRAQLLHPCERCAIPTRDPATQAKWPGLLSHLHAAHDQCFGINARVLSAGRIAAGEAVELA